METLLAYLLKSTICISVLYLVFRWTLKKESLFALNRFLLLAILLFSLAIPIIKLPELFPQTIDVKVLPEQRFHAMPNMDDVAMQITTFTTIPTPQYDTVSTERSLSVEQITSIVYVIGVLTLFIALLISLIRIGILLINTKVYRKKNYSLALVNGTASPMSFGRFIIMSKQDFKNHRVAILKHELAHIKFRHTYDLLLVELIKLFHWFNPLVYQLRNDLKEIQEFQVDQHLLRSGINSTEYQLLLIKKCVGAERFALANSFNHCQIKNRIVMMNNSRNSKGKSWKVAIFLPVAALMLMAFGSKSSWVPIVETTPVKSEIINQKANKENTSVIRVPDEKRIPYKLNLKIKADHVIINGKKAKQAEEVEIQLRKSLKPYPPSITTFGRSRSNDSIFYSIFTEIFDKVIKDIGWKYAALYQPISNETDNKNQDITVLDIMEVEDYFMINGKKVKVEDLGTELRKIMVENKTYKIVRDYGTWYTSQNNKLLSQTIDELIKERGLRHEEIHKIDQASFKRKEINIKIENGDLNLNTYKVEVDQIVPRIKILSKGFYGSLITIYHDGNSEVIKEQVRELLDIEKENINTDQKEEWIICENIISNYPK